MSRIAYVNGRYLPMRDAKVHVEDRGYQFADGVYEVCEVRGGHLIDERRHIERLQRSLRRIAHPHADDAARARRRAARSGGAQSYRLRHRLSADQPRRGAPRSRFSSRAVPPSLVVTARVAESGAQRQPRPKRASPSSACRTTAGAASISRPSACCRTCWRGRPRSSRARATPGSSTRTAPSRKRVRQRLHRHAGRQARHPAGRPRHPARHYPHRTFDAIKAQSLTVEERPFTLQEAYGRAKPSSPRRARSFCRW